MTETVTTDFVGSESASVVRQRLTDILTYHGFTPAGYANWAAARGDINVMLAVAGQTLLSNEEIASSFMPKLNAINRRSLAAQRLFAAGEQGAWFDPTNISTLFQDVAGTVPVTAPGQTVARINDRSGRGNHATQATAASRPVYGVQPRSGVRNLFNGSAQTSGSTFWANTAAQNGITITKLAEGIDTDGLPYVDVRYAGTATGSFINLAYNSLLSLTPAASGLTFTASAFVRLLAGTVAGISLSVAVVERTSSDGYIGETSNGAATTEQQLFSATRTITTGAKANASINVALTNGATIDATYRIKAVQFEPGSARTAYQRNFSAVNVTEDGVPTIGFLQFDGVDDFLQTPTITPGTDKAQIFAGVRKLSDDGAGVIAELSVNSNANQGSIGLLAPHAPAAMSYSFRSLGTVQATVVSPYGYFSPTTDVVTGVGDISGDVSRIRIDGTADVSNTGDQGTGNYLAYPLFIGRRGGTTIPFNGRIFSLITRFGPNLSPTEIARTEAWVNSRTGAY